MKKLPKIENEMLTTDQLAERWGLKPLTLAVWRMRDKKLIANGKKGKGPKWVKLRHTLQGEVRYSKKDIEAYEQENFDRVEKSISYKTANHKKVATIRVKLTKGNKKKR